MDGFHEKVIIGKLGFIKFLLSTNLLGRRLAYTKRSSVRHTKSSDKLIWFSGLLRNGVNTFILPWGEATITLEDVMVLGGFSVLGDSILCPLESSQLKEIYEKLRAEKREIAE